MSNAAKFFSRSRREDPFVTSFNEMLAFVQHAYDMTGQPDLRDMVDRARAQVGRLPRDVEPEQAAAKANADKSTLTFPSPVHQ